MLSELSSCSSDGILNFFFATKIESLILMSANWNICARSAQFDVWEIIAIENDHLQLIKFQFFSSVSPSAYKAMWPYAEDMIERPWFTHFISIVMFKEERAKTINNFIFCIFHNMKLRKFFISPRFRNCDDDDIFR